MSRRSTKVTVLGVRYSRWDVHVMCGEPRTDPEVLRALTELEYPDSLPWELAQNPSVPVEGLDALLRPDTVDRVLRNPSFRLSLIADPARVDGLSIAQKAAMVGSEALSESLLRHFLAGPTRIAIRVSAARNPRLPSDLIQRLLTDVERVRCVLAANPQLAPEHHHALAADPKVSVRVTLASRHDLSDETVDVLLHRREERVFFALYRNRSLSAEMRERVSADLVRKSGVANRWRRRNGRHFLFTH